jgi:hypothetical protein
MNGSDAGKELVSSCTHGWIFLRAKSYCLTGPSWSFNHRIKNKLRFAVCDITGFCLSWTTMTRFNNLAARASNDSTGYSVWQDVEDLSSYVSLMDSNQS